MGGRSFRILHRKRYVRAFGALGPHERGFCVGRGGSGEGIRVQERDRHGQVKFPHPSSESGMSAFIGTLGPRECGFCVGRGGKRRRNPRSGKGLPWVGEVSAFFGALGPRERGFCASRGVKRGRTRVQERDCHGRAKFSRPSSERYVCVFWCTGAARTRLLCGVCVS